MMSFPIVLEVLHRALDVGGLFAFISATKQQHTGSAGQRVINRIARSAVDSQLEQTSAQRFKIAKVAGSKPINSCHNPGACSDVLEFSQPIAQDVSTRSREVAAYFEGLIHCNL